VVVMVRDLPCKLGQRAADIPCMPISPHVLATWHQLFVRRPAQPRFFVAGFPVVKWVSINLHNPG